MPVHISFAKDIEFQIDDVNNLMVVRDNNWNRSREHLLVGPINNHLITSMQESLERLRSFAKE